MLQAVLLVFAVRRLGLSPGVIGGALTAGNLGFFVGAFLAARIGRRLGIGPALILAAILIGAGAVLVPLATPSAAVPYLIGYGVIASLGGVIYNVNARSFAQSLTPDRMLGRTIATLRFIVWGTIPIGSFLGGILGSRIGLRPTLWIAAVGQLTAFVPTLLSPVRRLRDMPELAEEPG
jgi:MFS family permease